MTARERLVDRALLGSAARVTMKYAMFALVALAMGSGEARSAGPPGPAGAPAAPGAPAASASTGMGGAGPKGDPGPSGAKSDPGAPGDAGTSGTSAVVAYGSFALSPPNNATTVATGAAVEFPQNGAASGIARATASTVTHAAIGDHELSWHVPINDGGAAGARARQRSGFRRAREHRGGTCHRQQPHRRSHDHHPNGGEFDFERAEPRRQSHGAVHLAAGGRHASVSATLVIKRLS